MVMGVGYLKTFGLLASNFSVHFNFPAVSKICRSGLRDDIKSMLHLHLV